MATDTLGYIVTINGRPAHWQADEIYLSYADSRYPTTLFKTRDSALRVIRNAASMRVAQGFPANRSAVVRVVR